MTEPAPEVWPQCGHCERPYVFRRCLSLSNGWGWYWQADCLPATRTGKRIVRECQDAGPVLVDGDGPVQTGGQP